MREDFSLSSAGGNLNGVQGERSATALNRLAPVIQGRKQKVLKVIRDPTWRPAFGFEQTFSFSQVVPLAHPPPQPVQSLWTLRHTGHKGSRGTQCPSRSNQTTVNSYAGHQLHAWPRAVGGRKADDQAKP